MTNHTAVTATPNNITYRRDNTMTSYIELGTYETGSRRGYCRVTDQGVHSPIVPLTAEQLKLRGNKRYNIGKALDLYQDATHYSITHHSYYGSSQYYYTTYAFYII